MKVKILILCLLTTFQLHFAQISDLKVGQKVPDLVITDYILNTPKDKKFTEKFKVVEFWATWCGPCLANVPHLNNLQKKYKNQKDLVFISISDEKPEKIKKTLSKIKFETIVVSDQSQKSHQALIMNDKKNYAIPQTILIDNNNIVKWIGVPSALNSELIDKFIQGKNIITDKAEDKPIAETKINTSLDSEATYFNNLEKTYNDESIKYSIALSESDPNKKYDMASYWDIENGKLMMFNWNLKSILGILNNVPSNRILLAENISNKKYDFFFKDLNLPKNTENNQAEMKAIITHKLKLKETKTTLETEVYLLKIIDEKKLKANENLSKSTSHAGTTQEYVNFDNMNLKSISERLNGIFNIMVFNETGSENKYNFLFKRSSLEELIKELNTYGLTLDKDKKNIEYIKYEMR